MKKNSNISEGAAIELLKRLFDPTPDKDTLTLPEIYEAAGRGDKDEDVNRNWLNTVMAKLRGHSLVAPVYKYDGRKKLEKVELTIAGKTALGRASNVNTTSAGSQVRHSITSYNDVAKAVSDFRNSNPEFEVIFEVKLKGDNAR